MKKTTEIQNWIQTANTAYYSTLNIVVPVWEEGLHYTTHGVHRCGPGGSMRACHAACPGSIPGRYKFPGWGFFGVFPHLYDKCREALGPQGPRISFAHHYHHQSSFITGANDLRCWRALKPQIYIHTKHWLNIVVPVGEDGLHYTKHCFLVWSCMEVKPGPF